MKDLGNAFTFPFRDPSWVSKFLIAALFLLLCLVGIGILVVAGYLVLVTQRVMRKEEYPLPPWSNIGTMTVLGLKYCVVYIIYLLPVVLLMLPLIVLGAVANVAPHAEFVGVLTVIYGFGFMLLIIPYSLAITALLPIIAYRFAMGGRISDALDVSAVLRTFRAHWQNTVVVTLIIVGVQSFAAIGVVFFLVGIFFTLFYAYLVSAYLHGALYLDHVGTEAGSGLVAS